LLPVRTDVSASPQAAPSKAAHLQAMAARQPAAESPPELDSAQPQERENLLPALPAEVQPWSAGSRPPEVQLLASLPQQLEAQAWQQEAPGALAQALPPFPSVA
jgi:hypothetical protein